MIPIYILIAWRYIYETKKIKNISTMLKISFLSILISAFGLSLAISIMLGFEKKLYEKMQSIHPQIIIQATNNYLNYDQISKVINKEFPQIEAYAPSDIQFAILNEHNSISNVIAIKGIVPQNEFKVSNIHSKITPNSNSLDNVLQKNKVIVGQKLAKELNYKIGDEIILLIPQDNLKGSKLSFEKTKVTISSLFNTGVDDFDNKVIFSSLEFLTTTFAQSGISQIGVKLKNNINEEQIINNLKKRLNLNVYSWKELYPDLISTLKIEKIVIFFIFLLISIIASMNIISLLFMIVSYKKRDLIILKSMGLKNCDIRKIFLLIGMAITLISCIFGLSLTLIASWFLTKFPFITLPDLYYASYLPIYIDLSFFLVIFLMIFLLGLISSLIPTKKILCSNIANELKNEN